MRHFGAVCLLGVALALSACGGDDDSPNQGARAPDTTEDTGSTATDQPAGKADAQEKRSANRQEKARSRERRKSSSEPRSRREGKDEARLRSRTRRALERARAEERVQLRKARELAEKIRSEAPPSGSEREAYLAARNVCRYFLPSGRVKGDPPQDPSADRDRDQEDLPRENARPRDPEDVARDYAKQWRPQLREAAYQGCRVGLRLRLSRR